jgi:hypothetical protein
MPMDVKKEERIWKDSLKRAIERGFSYMTWHSKYDPLGYQIISSQARLERKPFDELAIRFLNYTKMKAIAFSHEFAIAFFPNKQGDVHIYHMQQMCTYENFTSYLEEILDEEE